MRTETNKELIQETVYCAAEGCEAEAMYRTDRGMPLCESCKEVYQAGQSNPDGNVEALR